MNLSEIQKIKIQAFLKDKILYDVIYEIFMKNFMKPLPHQDVNILAASRIAIDYLNETFQELDKIAIEEKTSKSKDDLLNIGL